MQEKKPINIRVGANIQCLREERHYTQEGLSEKIGVTPNHLSAIERGVSGVSLELLEKLCGVLMVTSDRILFGPAADGTNEKEFLDLLKTISDEQEKILQLGENLQDIMGHIKEEMNG